jgi:hypothetical protein
MTEDKPTSAEPKSAHAFTEWARSRLDEMDAAARAMQAKAQELDAEARQRAAEALAEVQRVRDSFEASAKRAQEQGEGAWKGAIETMNNNWKTFEAGVQSWVDAAKTERDAFDARANAQLKAWQDTVDRYRTAASQAASERQAQLTTAVRRVEEQAQATRDRFDALRKASASSWSAMRKALDESRKAFEKAAEEPKRESDKT